MSVRHIHANPGEYIAVHRNGGYRSSRGGSGSGSSGGDGIGCLCIIGIILFCCFWKEILTIAFVVGILVLIGWLIWTFRTQIGKGLYIGSIVIWHGICKFVSYIINRFVVFYYAIKTHWSKRAQKTQPISISTQQKYGANYGKIIQK